MDSATVLIFNVFIDICHYPFHVTFSVIFIIQEAMYTTFQLKKL